MGFELNGDRLREARRYRRLTITSLSEKAGVSKQMVSRYERGTAQPGLDIFQKIVRTLQFPFDFFTGTNKFDYKDEGTYFRSRLTSTQSEKMPSETYKKAAGLVRNMFGEYVEFPSLLQEEITSRSPRAAAVQLRKLWGLGDKPIKNVLRLLESHGILVALVNSGSEKIDAHSGYVDVNQHRYYVVLVDANSTTFFRQQFSLTHELGHFILHSNSVEPQSLDSQEYRQMEKEADEFAAEFLLPAQAFENSISGNLMNLNEYAQLKMKWYVAAGAMVHRARSLRLINANQYLRLQKRISARGWRKQEKLDGIVKPSKPELLRESLDLLEDADVLQARELPGILNDKYGVAFPTEILAQVIGVPINRFKADIVQLKPSI
ncbi:ImmA/IrrE family metallo-endopeptidase [Lacticaseibacillus paracasei]|uniref:Transcriptional regulator, Xre family n=1 Tax=Lacticaseibacillus paracasei subsp. paracasei TaxID=47714 RepID=A0AAP9HIX9_LACPA|nr:XRE family transcriptional regulator [Lacticaseibacillus paracasei]MDC6273472.1 XRE family transcriptional regulator [Lacticaseibacillus paracasei]MDN4552685.1 XRE family transcriptional regulator [Lacticaseibacillus paracasei]QGV18624.1 Transcriptional regulator, Xre family [Lacticaseibacillus paracasei subsp. paracasei]RNE20030.1 helix-turn-helix protein [Lacticaseibacillus paracasei]